MHPSWRIALALLIMIVAGAATVDAGYPYFTIENARGDAPLTVQFHDASPGSTGVARFWDFGDGNTSTDLSPSHTYTAGGYYTVVLTFPDAPGRPAHMAPNAVAALPIPTPEPTPEIDGVPDGEGILPDVGGAIDGVVGAVTGTIDGIIDGIIDFFAGSS